MTTFFPTNDSETNAFERQAELKGAVGHIANELLENAMKFNDNTYDWPVSIQVQLHSDHLVLYVTNSILPENVF